jgi:hypothetical protein
MKDLLWYEDLLFWFLLRSPRINHITVELVRDTDDDQEDEELDDPELDFVPLLEKIYKSPSAETKHKG